MWKVEQFAKVGKKNLDLGLECQDCVSYYENGECQAIALADGAGDSNYAKIGADMSGETLVHLLVENFDDLYKMEEMLVQFQVIVNVKNKLYELCERYNVHLEQFQSTLLGVAINHKTKEFIAVHLGDGRIGIYKNGSSKILSYPENGVNKSYTKLTSGDKSGKSIRVYKGTLEEIEQFILISDGWEENSKSGKVISKSNTKNYDYKDDVAFIALRK